MTALLTLIGDLFQELIKVHYEKDEAKKAEGGEKLKTETLPKFLGIFEKLISSNTSGWIYGSKVTYADFALYNVMGWGAAAALDSFPGIKKNMEAVEALPNIAKWLKERPESQF